MAEIDLRLPALRRRRAELEAQLREWRNILRKIREGNMAGDDGPAMSSTTFLIQDSQYEYDELDYVIEYFDNRRNVSWFDKWQLLLIVAAIVVFGWLTAVTGGIWMR